MAKASRNGVIRVERQATANMFCMYCVSAHICTRQMVLPNSLEANMRTVICRFLRSSYFIKGILKSCNTKLAPEERSIFLKHSYLEQQKRFTKDVNKSLSSFKFSI